MVEIWERGFGWMEMGGRVQVQHKMLLTHSGKSIHTPSCFSQVPPMLPLKTFQCWSDWQRPFLIYCRKIAELSFNALSSLSSRQLMVCWSSLCPCGVQAHPAHGDDILDKALSDGDAVLHTVIKLFCCVCFLRLLSSFLLSPLHQFLEGNLGRLTQVKPQQPSYLGCLWCDFHFPHPVELFPLTFPWNRLLLYFLFFYLFF